MLALRQARIATRYRQCTALHHGFGSSAWRRNLLTLAIESSCDDTSVALVEKFNHPDQSVTAKVHFLQNITANTQKYRGIHPIETLLSHQENVAKLVQTSLESLPIESQQQSQQQSPSGDGGSQHVVRRRLPDFISATRGPGMRSNLSVGLDTAKGLAVAWQIPLVGVHHMQAHLLTPRLVTALRGDLENGPIATQPEFPFISMLISGGHSLIAHSRSLIDHEIIATTADIGMGTALDKSARLILPQELLESTTGTMYGKLLEQFAFPNGASDYADYEPHKTRGEEIPKRESKWGWSFTAPFANTRELKLSFSSVESTVNRIVQRKKEAGVDMSNDERIDLARETMRVSFEHLASRMILSLESLKGLRPISSKEQKRLTVKHKLYRSSSKHDKVRTLVVSGGVAANGYLMKILRSFLDARGYEHIRIVVPPPVLCTDNAAMIGWAGLEMYEAGWRTDLSAKVIKTWTLDPEQPDGGILGPDGWIRQDPVA